MARRLSRLGCTIFASVAACHSDKAVPAAAPSPDSIETAALEDTDSRAAAAMSGDTPMTPTTPSAAGAQAAAMSGWSITNPDPADVPAAVDAGMASTGSAGSSGAALPAQQPAANVSAAASCALPSQYTRAARWTVELTWPETIAFVGGAGPLVMWSKVTYTRNSAGGFELDARPCGALTPVATTTALAGGLKSSNQVPFAAFDSPNMPLERATAMQREDRSLSFAIGMLLGAVLPNPDGAWPSSAELVAFDHDGDGSPGVTAIPLEGPEYVVPPTSIAQAEFIDRVYIATRARLQVSITPTCSGTANGTVEPLDSDFSIIGCHVKNRDDCNASEQRFISNGLRYMQGASGTWTELEVPPAASCADVRAALPTP